MDIDVVDKTTLTGAVIASDTGDLTLATGSFEYSDIKDKDRSYNVGGGVTVGSQKTAEGDEATYNVNGSYGFSDSRQTNFATIGEGTIIVRDGNTDLSELNRDVSKAQYSTKEGGLQGGFVVDNTIVDFTFNTEEELQKTAEQIVTGYNEGKQTVEDVSEKSVNCYKSLDAGDGLTWENDDERLDRLVVKYSKHNDAEDAYGAYEDEPNGEHGKIINENNEEGDSDKLALITDPDEMGQGSIKLKETVGEVFDDIREDDSEMRITIDELEELSEGRSKKAEEFWNLYDTDSKHGDHGWLTEAEEAELKNNDKERYKLYKTAKNYSKASEYYDAASYRVDSVLTYIKTEDRNILINTTVGNLCNVEVYWEYGTVVGKENRTFKGFFGDELVKGYIGNVSSETGKANAYYGTGGNIWANNYGINQSKGSKKVKMGDKKVQEVLNNNSTGYAIIYKDKSKRNGSGPDHYSIIKKDSNGVWLDYDHNRRKAPEGVDFSKVHKVRQEVSKQEKKQ